MPFVSIVLEEALAGRTDRTDTEMKDARVGIVGDGPETIAEILTDGNRHAEPLLEDPYDDPRFLIAVGEASLCALATNAERVTVPVIPVEAGTGHGIDSVSHKELPGLLSSLRTSEGPDCQTISHPVLGVSVAQPNSNRDPQPQAHALVDVHLTTADPAQIAEYTVTSMGERVSRIRADGVVVATPAGSRGYAHAAGGPRIQPESGTGSVVPIAPFALSGDHWVVPLSEIGLSVERDVDVELFVDGIRRAAVRRTDSLTLTPVSFIETIRVDRRLEKL